MTIFVTILSSGFGLNPMRSTGFVEPHGCPSPAVPAIAAKLISAVAGARLLSSPGIRPIPTRLVRFHLIGIVSPKLSINSSARLNATARRMPTLFLPGPTELTPVMGRHARSLRANATFYTRYLRMSNLFENADLFPFFGILQSDSLTFDSVKSTNAPKTGSITE